MAIAFKTVDEVAADYLTQLKADKPEVSQQETDNDWWIRAHVTGGVMAGVYSDQRKTAEDAFPQSTRREGALGHVFTYFEETGFRPATAGVGPVRFTGTNGSTIPVGQTATYTPTGAIYTFQNTSTITLVGTSGTEVVKSVSVGQALNLPTGVELTLNSPPAGVSSTVVVLTPGITDARNEEQAAEAMARVLDFIRSGSPGGNAADYRKWARDADASVTDARVLRFFYGFGTVAIVIKAGTTDIDSAIDNGDPILVVPSSGLVTAVNVYVKSLAPETDCPTAIACETQAVSIAAAARFTTGDKDTVLAGQTLTQGQILAREITRALYKTPVGGTSQPGVTGGYLLLKDLQDAVDARIGAGPNVIGTDFQILTNRTITISGGSPDLTVVANKQTIPNVITVTNL